MQLVYTPADGSAPTTLDVYDFKAGGVAMAMYNTDEVGAALFRSLQLPLTAGVRYEIVDYWLRTRLVQDGFGQEDASREQTILCSFQEYISKRWGTI